MKGEVFVVSKATASLGLMKCELFVACEATASLGLMKGELFVARKATASLVRLIKSKVFVARISASDGGLQRYG